MAQIGTILEPGSLLRGLLGFLHLLQASESPREIHPSHHWCDSMLEEEKEGPDDSSNESANVEGGPVEKYCIDKARLVNYIFI